MLHHEAFFRNHFFLSPAALGLGTPSRKKKNTYKVIIFGALELPDVMLLKRVPARYRQLQALCKVCKPNPQVPTLIIF